MERVTNQLQRDHDEAGTEHESRNPLVVRSRPPDGVAEAGKKHQEADHDERIGERSACEDERAGPGYERAGRCRILDTWFGSGQIVERERCQEHDEAGDAERTRPAPHLGVVHNKAPSLLRPTSSWPIGKTRSTLQSSQDTAKHAASTVFSNHRRESQRQLG